MQPPAQKKIVHRCPVPQVCPEVVGWFAELSKLSLQVGILNFPIFGDLLVHVFPFLIAS